ncbi:DNA ligase 1-like [Sycon ciliatum]|uniref:DNA ligase 1-like n=1 Tax=Sycon ciliatum TaxID=27933 RepID=UPI0031F6FB4F
MMAQASLLSFFGKKADKENKPLPATSAKTATGKDETAAVATAAATEGEDIISKEASDAKTTADQTATVVTGKRTRKAIESGSDAEQDDTAVAVKKKKKRVSIAETPVQQESAPSSKPRTVASQGTSESQDDGNASPTTPRSKKQRRRKVRVLASSSDEDDDEDTSATSPHTNTSSSVGSNSKSSKEQSDTAMETGDDDEEGGETVSDAPEAAAEEVTSPKEAGKRVTATKSKPVKSARGRSRGNSMLMKKIASVGKKPAEQQQKIKSPPKTKATEKAADTPVAKEEESKADTAEASKTEEATAEETMNVVEDAPATQDVQPDALEAEATVTSADNAEADDEPAVTARSKRTRRKVRVLDSSSEDEGEEEEKKSKETSSPVSKKTSASRKKSTPSSSSRQPRRKTKDADSARPADSAGKDEAPNTTTSADTGEKEDTTPEETGGDAQDTEKRVSATKSKPTKTARGRSRGNSMLMKKIASVGKKPAAEQQPDKTNQTTATTTVAAAETEQTTAAASSADNAVTEESESADTTRTTDVAKEEKEEPMDTSSEPMPTPITCKVKAESKTAASGVKSEGTSSTVATGKAASVLSSSSLSSSAKGGHSSMPMPAINASSPKKRIPLSFFSPKSSSVQTATKASSTPGSATTDEKSCQPQVYNPAKANYHPVTDACWTLDSKNVPYLALARTLCLIEETSARLKITSILCNFFRSVIALAPDQLLACIYLCLNELGPAHEGLELGIGDSIVMKAISMATGRSMQALKSQMVELGDLGLVAEKSRSKQSMMYVPAALTVKKVFSQLKDIAQMTGSKSQQKKIEKINSLLVAGRDCEPRYIARSLTGKLRIGLAEQTLLMALAHAVVYTPPSSEIPVPKLDCSHGVSAEKFKARLDAATLIVKSTQSELPNYDDIVPALLEYGVDELPQHCKMTPGIPLKPMLAHPTKEIAEVLRRFDGCDFTCEYKYDGERAQIHLLEDGSIRIFSRNREDNTSKYPDIIARIPNMVKEGVKSFVIDTEAVAWDCEKKEIQPFQVLSTRKRKDADASEIKVQVCTFAFDLLYLNGKCFVKEPFRARRQALQDSFNTVDGEFMFVTQRDCTEPEQIEEFLDLSIQGNCEGLMVKTLDIEATYEIAKRSHNWLKVKKDYLEGMGDSLDLAVLGGYFGAGKRQGVYGAFLLACYNQDSEQYETVCKIGTGLKDDELQKHTKFFTEHVLGGPKSYYSHGSGAQQPDVWFDAVQVWEVKAADFTISPVYTAASGLVDASKGISMRFPRFIRIRDDKKAEDATSSEQMADMYRSQQNKKTSHAKPADDDEFY